MVPLSSPHPTVRSPAIVTGSIPVSTGGSVSVSAKVWGLIPIIGLASSGIYLAYFFAYRAGDASAVEAGSFSMLLFSPALGYLIFSEIPDASFWFGAGLLVCGIGLIIIEPKGHAH